MANKAANIDFSGAMNRMRQTTKEEPRTQQSSYEESRVGEDVRKTSEPVVEEGRRGPGRKRKENKLRSNPTTVFFDNETARALTMIKVNNNIDKKDLVLAATREFLSKYYLNGDARLGEEGVRSVFSNLGGILNKE